MKSLKKLLSALSLIMLVSCSSSDSHSLIIDDEVKQQIDSVLESDEGNLLTGKLENKTIKFLSSWDINPDSTGKSVPLELALFQQKYGGNVQTKIVSFDERFEQLAYSINGGEGIDFFPAADFDAFPKGAVKDMFVPVDDYIDFSSDLWKDVKDVNDSFMWNGSHYLMCTDVTLDSVIIYNKSRIDELGFDDPAELYKKGEWNWDTFRDMLMDYCDEDNERYGLDGWFFESALSKTTGKPYISLENGKIVNNLRSADIEKVQNYIYNLYKLGLIMDKSKSDWTEHPEYIGLGKELFYPCGIWKLFTAENRWSSIFGEDTAFVPVPKSPYSDKYYVPVGIDGYLLVKDSQNPEGVVKFAECKRFSMLSQQITDIAEKQFKKDYGWSDEMIDMKKEIERLARENPVFDFYNAVSTDISLILDSQEYGIRASANGVPWSETLDSISNTIDKLIDEAVSE